MAASVDQTRVTYFCANASRAFVLSLALMLDACGPQYRFLYAYDLPDHPRMPASVTANEQRPEAPSAEPVTAYPAAQSVPPARDVPKSSASVTTISPVSAVAPYASALAPVPVPPAAPVEVPKPRAPRSSAIVVTPDTPVATIASQPAVPPPAAVTPGPSDIGETCEKLAARHKSDAGFSGFDASVQQQVYSSALAECRAWRAAH